MTILSSAPDLITRNLKIFYKAMAKEKIVGGELEIVCQSFKNPIYQKEWAGFVISMYDSEPIPNPISVSDILSFNSNGFKPALIPRNGLTITPTIFKIAEFSIWVFSVTTFPIPLETECYAKITIPADLAFEYTTIKGTQMFLTQSQDDIVDGVDQVSNPDGTKTVKFRACYRANTVGPSP
jgi:hypothetical protein